MDTTSILMRVGVVVVVAGLIAVLVARSKQRKAESARPVQNKPVAPVKPAAASTEAPLRTAPAASAPAVSPADEEELPRA